MILPYETTPDKSLYVIGAEIIKVFSNEQSSLIDIKILFDKINSPRKKQLSFNYFLYALDWLYLEGLVTMEQKYIRKCF